MEEPTRGRPVASKLPFACGNAGIRVWCVSALGAWLGGRAEVRKFEGPARCQAMAEPGIISSNYTS